MLVIIGYALGFVLGVNLSKSSNSSKGNRSIVLESAVETDLETGDKRVLDLTRLS